MAEIFDPKGKTFKQKIDAFIQDVKDTHKITIRLDNGRTVEWQQKHHVAHMFLYNAYKSTKPANADVANRTIKWEHISDPKVVWNTIKWQNFLRTKTNQTPIKMGNAWKTGSEPDKAATEKHVKSLLSTAQIGNSGKAMVSAGLKPCGEPCKCGAGRSKHLDGVAADLNTGDLDLLVAKLVTNKAGSLDDYLKKYGLHRPLLNHPSSPEKWHIEEI